MSDEAIVSQVSREILDYMRRYPDAADTEEYISRWWLSEDYEEQLPGIVLSALSQLVSQGNIERIELPDNRVIYRNRKFNP